MRRRKAQATAGQISQRTLLSRRTFTLAICLAVAVWVAYTFAQEAMLSHQLNQQELQLQQSNSQLRQQNDAYQRDILSIESGSGLEEEARLNGFAKPGEKVFLVVPARRAQTAATRKPAVKPAATAPPALPTSR